MLLGSISAQAYENDNETNQGEQFVTTYDKSVWYSNEELTYPVTEDDEQWMEYQTHEEMIAACNMPDELVSEVETEKLVELMLEYPLLGDLLLYDNTGDGLEILSHESNILAELLKREDGGERLLDVYCDFEIKETSIPEEILYDIISGEVSLEECIEDEQIENKIEQDKENLVQSIFLEAALVREEIVEKLTEEEINQLADTAEDKVSAKEMSSIYSAYTYSFYEMAQQLETIENFGQIENETVNVESSKATRDTTTTVKTPNGSSVEVIQRTYRASESLSAYKYTVENYPNVEIVSNATTNYNCHSYAWYSQSTSNVYWMENPGLYMTDGSYTKVGTTPTATGQKVCYTQYPLVNPYVHSGIVYSISGSTIKLKSKWGSGPLVIHNVSYSPYGGTAFYYER